MYTQIPATGHRRKNGDRWDTGIFFRLVERSNMLLAVTVSGVFKVGCVRKVAYSPLRLEVTDQHVHVWVPAISPLNLVVAALARGACEFHRTLLTGSHVRSGLCIPGCVAQHGLRRTGTPVCALVQL